VLILNTPKVQQQNRERRRLRLQYGRKRICHCGRPYTGPDDACCTHCLNQLQATR
jgi:hypothetical protein